MRNDHALLRAINVASLRGRRTEAKDSTLWNVAHDLGNVGPPTLLITDSSSAIPIPAAA